MAEPPEKGFEVRWCVTKAWMVRANVNIVAMTAGFALVYLKYSIYVSRVVN